VITYKKNVAVLGAGHGGLALAAYLSGCGHRVVLWNRSPERIAAVTSLGGIRLTLPGSTEHFAPIAFATNNIDAALSGAKVVLVAVPASGHAEVARACAPFLRDGQTVLLLPGRTGGALEFAHQLQHSRCGASILLGEANTFPVAARTVGPATTVVYGTKAAVLVSALPARRTPELLAACRPLLPMLSPARSVLHTGLINLGAILHPVITLLNAGRIEAGSSFDFYTQGVTPRVATALAAADAERLKVSRAYGVPACSLPAWIESTYNHRADTLQKAISDNPAYSGIKAPTFLDHRYLLEDVPTGLIPLLELGEAAGLSLPTLRSLIELSRVLLGGERWQRARTLDVLGLDGLTASEIRGHIESGFGSTRRPVEPSHAVSYGRLGSSLALIPQA
jgi:opine dehydrogenase